MLEFIGWAAILLVTLWASAMWGIVAWDGLGQYNIGGVPNSTKKKLTIFAFASVPAGFWWLSVTTAPFTLTVQ